MIQESKKAIKDVFDNFDKDKSGFVDSNELQAIAKELNQPIEQSEVDKLMKILDANKDGKVSFQEFWDWWQYGKNGKLEKLVFLKLKALNLVKKVHSEFTRFGGSLLQKYEGEMNRHYFAINYGESKGKLRLNLNARLCGRGIQSEIDKVKKGMDIKEAEFVQVLIALKNKNPVQAKENFQNFFSSLKTKLKEKFGDEEFSIIILDEENLEVEFGNTEEEVLILIKLKHPILTETISDQYLTLLTTMGQDLDVKAEVNVGIKNGFEEFLNKNIKFQKWLLCGFVYEMQVTTNKDLMNNVFRTLLLLLKDSFDFKYSNGKEKLKQRMIFPLLLRSSKIHLTFKDMEDVDDLFKGLGLEELVQDQPSGNELLQETFTEYEKEQFNDPDDIKNQFYLFVKLVCEEILNQGQISVFLKNSFATGTFTSDGVKEAFDICFKQNDQE